MEDVVMLVELVSAADVLSIETVELAADVLSVAEEVVSAAAVLPIVRVVVETLSTTTVAAS